MLYLGLVLNLVIPLGFLALGFVLRKNGMGANPISNLKLIFWVLFFVSAGEILALYIVKKIYLTNAAKKSLVAVSQIPVQKSVVTFSVLIFSLSLAPSIYGFIYFLLGGTLEEFLLFIAVTLVGFRIFKPKLEDIKKLAGAVTPA